MKRQLLATIIEAGGRQSIQRIYMNAEGDKLRCTCSKEEVPNVDVDDRLLYRSCWHIDAVFEGRHPVLAHVFKINFTEAGLLEFSWRWAVTKLVESA